MEKKVVVVVDLAAVAAGDVRETQACVEELRREGWVRVKTGAVGKRALEAAHELAAFFGQDEDRKMEQAHESPLLGYNAVRGVAEDGSDGTVFKEKLTFVTTRLDKAPGEKLREVVASGDALLQQVCRQLAKHAGKEREVEAAIPLARESAGEKKVDSWGLFDVALYRNAEKKRGVPAGMNVAAHTDPGLVAVVWHSSAPGLQLYSRTASQWISVPEVPEAPEMGVMWAGNAGHNLLQFERGIHRVLYGEEPRISMWTEAAVPDQLAPSGIPELFPELDNALPEVGKKVVSAKLQKLSPKNTKNSKNSNSNSNQSISLGGNLERLIGVPSMKSGMVPRGCCQMCQKKGEFGRELRALCRSCQAVLCDEKCGAAHTCTRKEKKGGGIFGF